MTHIEQTERWAARKRKADEILAEAEKFKVCEQCCSILYKSTAICGICGSYRFSESPSAVRSTVEELKQTPFPITSAVVPRV